MNKHYYYYISTTVPATNYLNGVALAVSTHLLSYVEARKYACCSSADCFLREL